MAMDLDRLSESDQTYVGCDDAGDVGTDPDVEFPDGGAQAWLAILGGTASMFCTMGFLNAFGIFQDYYSQNQLKSYSQSTIAWLGSVQIFFEFACGIVSGPLFDRYGTIAFIPASVTYVVSIMLTSLCREFWQFFLAQTLLGGISIGFIFTPGVAIVGHYFQKKRAFAMGVVVSGSSIGGLVFPIVLNRLLYNNHLSFGWSVRICGFIIMVGLAFAALVLKPRFPPQKRNFDKSILRSQLYILTVIGVWLINWGMYVPFFYLPSYAIKQGMSPSLAPYMVAILNGASLFGRILTGMVADEFGRYDVLAAVAVFSSVLLFCWQAISSNAGIIVFSVVAGFFMGALVSLYPSCIVQIIPDPKNSGVVLGISSTIWAFACLTGTPVAGAILSAHSFAQVGDFAGAVVLAGGAIVAAARIVAQPKLSRRF
ncbi:Riboflavin transporter MCH5 [Pleurostoma richardsiae]|uniref:Riboflavin transporter MCH5 n=1 Tax=Pleurostoma richardsiae TaxID=41990 RepID=A0AA38R9S5_9PEZI|nr:Riboflavin transporter MCH5 [Pleurostoma richardsiae]